MTGPNDVDDREIDNHRMRAIANAVKKSLGKLTREELEIYTVSMTYHLSSAYAQGGGQIQVDPHIRFYTEEEDQRAIEIAERVKSGMSEFVQNN